ncbi:MAG: ferredoxin [Nitrospirae bacterium]|nr:ferredoxin [Nitrospirota bacterium]
MTGRLAQPPCFAYVDAGLCVGRAVGAGVGLCDICVQLCPDVFAKPSPGACACVSCDDVDRHLDRVFDAVQACPAGAIQLVHPGSAGWLRAEAVLKLLPHSVPARCTGCGLCVEACEPGCIEIVGGVAVLARPELCASEEDCVASCPENAIRMVWMPGGGERSVGLWRDPTPALWRSA